MSGPKSYAWLLPRLATSTPASAIGGRDSGGPRKVNSLASGLPRVEMAHSRLTTVRSSRRNRPSTPDHAYPYPLAARSGMYEGSRLTSPVPWMRRRPFGSGFGFGDGPMAGETVSEGVGALPLGVATSADRPTGS